MGTLLLVSIPFAAGLIASGKPAGGSRGKASGLLTVGAGGLLVVLVGLVLNRSTVAILLALPVIAFSALLLPGDWRRQRLLFAGAAVLTLIAVALFTNNPVQSEIAGEDASPDLGS